MPPMPLPYPFHISEDDRPSTRVGLVVLRPPFLGGGPVRPPREPEDPARDDEDEDEGPYEDEDEEEDEEDDDDDG